MILSEMVSDVLLKISRPENVSSFCGIASHCLHVPKANETALSLRSGGSERVPVTQRLPHSKFIPMIAL